MRVKFVYRRFSLRWTQTKLDKRLKSLRSEYAAPVKEQDANRRAREFEGIVNDELVKQHVC